MNDKIVIELTFERNKNGTVSKHVKMEGEGFHFFELIGLLQICCYDFAKPSSETASELPQDKDVRIKFTSENPDTLSDQSPA